jgi:hypothetical protein
VYALDPAAAQINVAPESMEDFEKGARMQQRCAQRHKYVG